MIRLTGRDILADPDDCVWPRWAGKTPPEPCESCQHPVVQGRDGMRRVEWVEHDRRNNGDPHNGCGSMTRPHTAADCSEMRVQVREAM